MPPSPRWWCGAGAGGRRSAGWSRCSSSTSSCRLRRTSTSDGCSRSSCRPRRSTASPVFVGRQFALPDRHRAQRRRGPSPRPAVPGEGRVRRRPRRRRPRRRGVRRPEPGDGGAHSSHPHVRGGQGRSPPPRRPSARRRRAGADGPGHLRHGGALQARRTAASPQTLRPLADAYDRWLGPTSAARPADSHRTTQTRRDAAIDGRAADRRPAARRHRLLASDRDRRRGVRLRQPHHVAAAPPHPRRRRPAQGPEAQPA